MTILTPDQIKSILEDHKQYLAGTGGKRADLRSANLYGADLRGADLSGANLRGAYLVGQVAVADKYDPDPRIECTNGIHFFMTRKEAEEFSG